MVLGAQCYNLRNFMQSERDIRRSLQKIAQIGYTTVQISGVAPIDPRKLRAMCDENGLQIVLTHIPEGRFLDDIDGVLAEHEIYGCDYIGLGAMPQRYRGTPEWLEYFAEDFLPAARKIRDAGKLFMYHNHHFEFEPLPDGRLLMDAILDAFPADLMGVTLDTYWLQAGGVDILQWIDKLSGRLPCVHLKDMTVHGGEVRMAAVGEGNIDFAGILAALKKGGKTKYMLVEQDTCYDESPFVCLRKSYENVVKLGYK